MVCSKCKKKIWIWNEKKIGNKVFCKECYNELKLKDKNSTSGPYQDIHIDQNNVKQNISFEPEYKLNEHDIEIGFHIAIKEATKNILYGILWFMGGLIVTIINPFFLFWGAIIFGFYDIVRGIYRFFVFKSKFRKYINIKDSGEIIDLNDYRIDNILYKNLLMIDKETIISQKKKLRIFIVISLFISGLILGGVIFGSVGWFGYNSVLYDEDFNLMGDGTIPTENTYLEYMSYEVDKEGYDYATIDINLHIDNGKKVDLHIHDSMSISLFDVPGDYIEDISSYSGTYRTSSNAPLTIYVDIWNANNYEEVTGHIRIE